MVLAAIVAAACLGGCAAIALLTGGSGAAGVATPAKTGSSELAALRAVPHGQSVPGMSERKLLELETATLGPEHALEHAAMRRTMQTEAPRAEKPSAKTIQKARQAATVEAAALGEPSEIGRWDFDATATFPIVAIHAALLPTGKVMFFSYPLVPEWKNSAEAYLWDPVTNDITRKDPPLWLDPKDGVEKPANIWCAGHTFTADGELVVFGGNLDFEAGPTGWKGLNKVYTFNRSRRRGRSSPKCGRGAGTPPACGWPTGGSRSRAAWTRPAPT